AVIGSATAERGRDSIGGAADEATHHRDFSILDQRLHQIAGAFSNRVGLRLRRHEVGVGDENVPRFHVLGWKATQLEERGNQVRRELLAEGRYRIKTAWCSVTEDRQRFGQTGELVEGRTHLRGNFRRLGSSAEQLFALLKMAIAQALDSAKRADQMALC